LDQSKDGERSVKLTTRHQSVILATALVGHIEDECVVRTPTPGDAMSQRSVLVVDDDADCREVMADILYDDGYTVMTAHGGRAALEMLQAVEQPPDLMLLDIMMPDFDGYALLSELSKSAQLAQIPTILISASVRMFASAGPSMSWPNVCGRLHKPVHLETLIEVVRKCLADSCTGPRLAAT
jgi:CheY-like chemotaxis protein